MSAPSSDDGKPSGWEGNGPQDWQFDPDQLPVKPCQVLAELFIRHEKATGFPPQIVVMTRLFTVALGLQLKMNNLIPMEAEVPLDHPFVFRGVLHTTSDAAFPNDMPVAAAVFPVAKAP